MRKRWNVTGALTAALAVAIAVAAPAFGGREDVAIVRVNGLELRANGAVVPQGLPLRRYAPVRFAGYGNVRALNGGIPPAAKRVVVNFDRDGRPAANGLPACPPSRVAALPPLLARQACRGAIVGTGTLQGIIALPGLGPVKVTSPLTIFNGPRRGRNLTAVLHAWTKLPVPEIYAPVATLERRAGGGVRVSLDVPEIAGGLGSITRLAVKIGRRWRFRGRRPSYTSARCSRGVLITRGRFGFADGTVISGDIFTPCHVKRARRRR